MWQNNWELSVREQVNRKDRNSFCHILKGRISQWHTVVILKYYFGVLYENYFHLGQKIKTTVTG